jgi:hypothetical protein
MERLPGKGGEMNTSTYLRRFTRLLILGAAIAGATASVAGADWRPSDVSQATTPNATVPDVFERYAAAHPYGSDLSTSDARPDVRDHGDATTAQSRTVEESVVDRIIAQERARNGDLTVFGSSPSAGQSSTAVTRPPDVRDAASAAETVSAGQGDGFDWGDYAIGIGSGIGLSLLLAGALGAGLQRRGRMQTA